MQRSNTLVSDYISELREANDIIQESLLRGEQCAFINDAACIYNGLRSLITPEYLTDEEFRWLGETANSWNIITRTYNKQMNDNGIVNEDMQYNMDQLSDALKGLLDDLGITDTENPEDEDCV